MASCCRIAARFRGTGQVTGLRVFASLCVRHGWTFWGSAVLFVVVLTAEARAGAPAPLTLKAYRDTITVDDVDVALRVGGLKQRIAALGRGFDDASRLILTQHGTVLAEDAVVDDAVTAAPTHVTYAVTCVRAHAGGGGVVLAPCAELGLFRVVQPVLDDAITDTFNCRHCETPGARLRYEILCARCTYVSHGVGGLFCCQRRYRDMCGRSHRPGRQRWTRQRRSVSRRTARRGVRWLPLQSAARRVTAMKPKLVWMTRYAARSTRLCPLTIADEPRVRSTLRRLNAGAHFLYVHGAPAQWLPLPCARARRPRAGWRPALPVRVRHVRVGVDAARAAAVRAGVRVRAWVLKPNIWTPARKTSHISSVFHPCCSRLPRAQTAFPDGACWRLDPEFLKLQPTRLHCSF